MNISRIPNTRLQLRVVPRMLIRNQSLPANANMEVKILDTWKQYKHRESKSRIPRKVLVNALLTTASITGIFVCGGVLYYSFVSHQTEGTCTVPKSWSIPARICIKWANYKALTGNYEKASQWYKTTRIILTGSGELQETYKVCKEKPPLWQRGYSDLLALEGSSLAAIGSPDQAASCIIESLRMPYSTKSVRSHAAVVMSQIEQQKGDSELELQYLHKAVRAIAPSQVQKQLDTKKPVVVPDIEINVNCIRPIMELGKYYARSGRLIDALQCFLSLHRGIVNTLNDYSLKYKERPRKCEEAESLSHISEVLWALGRKQEAISWAEDAVKESRFKTVPECAECARTAAFNVASMYEKLGKIEESKQYTALAHRIKTPKEYEIQKFMEELVWRSKAT